MRLKDFELMESRVFRDPIHGYIRVKYRPIWQMINTKEMQRLRRIHQLGGTHMVYQCAEHTRFTHSLGVYQVVTRILELVSLSDEDQLAVMMAALLHDVGHGPFSHCFEHVYPYSHELYTQKIILDPSTEVHQVLTAVDARLPEKVASIIGKTHPNALLIQIVSSQLDADRMDYLLRDSYFSGTSYGTFDMERILRTMRFVDGKMVIKQSGIQAVENYILARYHMYWQVYYHPVTRSYERLLVTIFKRLRYLLDQGEVFDLPYLMPFLKGDMVDVASYLELDEYVLMYDFKVLSHHHDPILSDLCFRFINRKIFKHQCLQSDEMYDDICAKTKALGYDPTYYVMTDDASATPYVHYDAGHEVEEISILMEDGRVRALPEVSEIVRAIVDSKVRKVDRKIYYPKEVVLG